MKFTLAWLCDHLDTSHNLAEICDALPMLGLEVEELLDPAAGLAPFRVVEITSAEQHPDADRLRVCQVNTGDETVQIVCGAPNARAGLKTIMAPVGSFVPGPEITIKKGNIRGQASHGMLCSPGELNLANDSDGITELPQDAPVGADVASYVSEAGLYSLDPVIDIAITPNRGDCLGVRGVARDLAAAGYGTLKPLDLSDEAGSFDSPLSWQIDKTAHAACPLISGRMFEGVQNGASPDWMARRLDAVGQRPISALVDITNYVMIDLGRPLHAYDVDKIAGNTLTVRMAYEGEKILALNEKTYICDPEMLVIGDADGADDLAGIMGGERSGVSDTTTRMFLEIAIFDPISVATTGRKLNINSDARYRFERGLDITSPQTMAGYIARLVML
jgi:phenylalanyl-tRNA synthetase beta chain